MAKAGAGEASALTFDGVSMPMVLTAIPMCFVSNVSAHGGGLNAEGYHHDCKRGGYHCHRGGGASSRSDAVSTNRHASPRIAPLRVWRDSGVFANYAEVRAARATSMRRGEPGYGPHLDCNKRCERRWT
jgi:hypothetical protein